ncbi:unnamed protein product [Phytophthora lilii]|uniref:Unnamed protein product n=1 Tax=Phytophthora lilii TaxID=2077276 RepID=A0A9W6TAR0_9STRA|nr:unnamed protein product [Phytophthora lilii]
MDHCRGRKPFACAFPGCDRSFARKFDLHKHQRLHEDQADVSGKAKTKKRKLTPRQTGSSTSTPKKLDSGDESCDCPSDVATPFVGNASSPDAALNADVLLPESLPVKTPVPIPSTCVAARRKMSATAACLDTPTRPMRYEMKCPENHIHSPPACLAGLSSLDAFLLSQETLDLSRPFALDAFPPHCPSTSIGTSCCPAHLELRPPPPDDSTNAAGPKMSTGPDMIDQLLSTLPPTSTTTNNTMSKEVPPANTSGAMSGSGLLMNSTFAGSASMGSTLADSSMVFIAPDANGSTLVPSSLMSSSTTTSGGNTAAVAALGAQVTTSANAGTSSADFASTSIMNCLNIVNGTSAGQNKAATEKACLSTPASSLLDYSRHNRSCGHLSIQHGNHRDYVVQNHLVCQDSVTRLGALQRIPANAKTEAKAMPAQPVKCTSPKDTHRPGCGHLPVRHKDHIDYVVEDNLICQQASWLEDDNLELLGDDFWDFYGAIDAFPTN